MGVDCRFWAGHYGPKICRTCIKLLPPDAPIAPNSVSTEEYHQPMRHAIDHFDEDEDEISDSISSASASEDDDVSLD